MSALSHLPACSLLLWRELRAARPQPGEGRWAEQAGLRSLCPQAGPGRWRRPESHGQPGAVLQGRGPRGSRASGPAPWVSETPDPWPRLCLQAPIRESLISLSDEDLNRRAVDSFRGEWPAWAPCPWCFSYELATAGWLGGDSRTPAASTHFHSRPRGCGLCRFWAGRPWRCTAGGCGHPQDF